MGEPAKKILLAEDNLAIAKVLEFNLARAGFAVTHAADGAVAAEAAAREAFDLVITDYQMPKLNGEQLCQSIRTGSLNRETPIVLCSAKGLEFDATHLRETYDVIKAFAKPFSPGEVVAYAWTLLNPAMAHS